MLFCYPGGAAKSQYSPAIGILFCYQNIFTERLLRPICVGAGTDRR